MLILVSVLVLLFIGVIGVAFSDVGLSHTTTLLVLVFTLLGSFINIPIFKLKTTVPMIEEEFVSFFGMMYRIPRLEIGEKTTTIAVNVGGALIPTFVSIYLLLKQPSAVLYALAGIVIVSLVSHAVARPVKGVGIAMPPFVAPLVAALLAYLLPSGAPKMIAYVSGVLGTLIGADLSNLGVIPELGAPVASIGGAGTFDGVFLSGIIAVLLA
jgi:uncharacterized membrane protein